MRLELYSKHRCPLCEEAHEVLLRLAGRFRFDLTVRYIEDSPDAWGRFRYDVPVLFIDGERAFHHRLDEGRLEALLSKGGTRVAQSRPRDA